MNNKPIFRNLTIDDVQMLSDIGKYAFKSAFGHLNTKADMKQYLEKAFHPKQLTTELENKNYQFILAEVSGKPAGYAKLQEDRTPDCILNKPALEISRFYAMPEFIGKKVGAALMDKCLAVAEDYKAIWLSSWKINDRANQFYAKFGFEIKGEVTFQMGADIQHDHILVKSLK